MNALLKRRTALQWMAACGLSIGSSMLPSHAARRRRDERAKSVITLWMNGGMSQLETWDPHPGTKVGGDVVAINTSVPGLKISDFLPQMAEKMDQVCLIRSLTSQEGDHARGAAFAKTGYRLDPTLVYPSLGAIAAHELPNPTAQIPQHISLGGEQFFPRGGYLGNQYDAFRVLTPGRGVNNLKMHVNDNRLKQRQKSFDFMAEHFQKHRPTATEETQHSGTVHRALTMMSSEQLKAFEIDQEPDVVKQAYGDTRFGRGCLVARRLIEVGVRSIEVCLNGFDTHTNNHDGQKTQADVLDPAFATLLSDLKQRDLLDSTVVLCLTEFGRTPTINPAGGRDHFPHWFSAVIAGGGFRQGVVLGETDAKPIDQSESAKKPTPKAPVTIPDLYATVMKTMGISYDHEYTTPIGRPMKFASGKPIDRLLES